MFTTPAMTRNTLDSRPLGPPSNPRRTPTARVDRLASQTMDHLAASSSSTRRPPSYQSNHSDVELEPLPTYSTPGTEVGLRALEAVQVSQKSENQRAKYDAPEVDVEAQRQPARNTNYATVQQAVQANLNNNAAEYQAPAPAAAVAKPKPTVRQWIRLSCYPLVTLTQMVTNLAFSCLYFENRDYRTKTWTQPPPAWLDTPFGKNFVVSSDYFIYPLPLVVLLIYVLATAGKGWQAPDGKKNMKRAYAYFLVVMVGLVLVQMFLCALGHFWSEGEEVS